MVLAIAGFLFSQELTDRTNYDEGVYLASLDALRHGDALGKDVFASQPPGFYVLLRFIGVFAGRSIEDIRIGFFVIGLVGVAAAFFIGRRLAGSWGAVAAAALVVVTPPYAAFSTRVSADTPSIALALVALAIASMWLKRGAFWQAFGCGAVAAAAISVKFLALPILVPLAILALQRRIGVRAFAGAVAGAFVVAAALALAYADVLPQLWSDSVEFQRASGPLPVGESAGTRFVHYFSLRTPSTWAVLAGLLAALGFRRQLALWAFVVAALTFLALQEPLLDHHFVLLAAAIGLAAGASLGSATGRIAPVAVAAAFAVALGGWAQDYRQIHRAVQPEPTEIRRAAAFVRTIAGPNERVASDLPIVDYFANRREPGTLVDTSAARFQSGSLKPMDVGRSHAHVFVAGREFLHRPATIAGLKLIRRFGAIEILRRP